MDKINVLVFPCGSEIGLEVFRSLRYSLHFRLFGGSSINDHGRFVYKNYIGGIPFITEDNFNDEINAVIKQFKIEIIYPTMDAVIHKLISNSSKIDCKIASSPLETTSICLSKSKTYNFFDKHLLIPIVYKSIDDVKIYPVFLKPDVGYSGRRARRAFDYKQAAQHLHENPDCLILEDLPGEEYTVDCLTDKNRRLLFVGPRKRNRISNGISVNTFEAELEIKKELEIIAVKINNLLEFRGAWFFQVKRDANNEFRLLEVAARLGGSSALFRAKGINFALLTLWDLLDYEIKIIENKYTVEMDRALDVRYKIELEYDNVFVDLDDALIIDNKINITLIAFLYRCINENKRITLITKHDNDLKKTLTKFKIESIFNNIIHLKKGDEKYKYIKNPKSIFIDDSFLEREKVAQKCNINVFDTNMLDVLL